MRGGAEREEDMGHPPSAPVNKISNVGYRCRGRLEIKKLNASDLILIYNDGAQTVKNYGQRGELLLIF